MYVSICLCVFYSPETGYCHVLPKFLLNMVMISCTVVWGTPLPDKPRFLYVHSCAYAHA